VKGVALPEEREESRRWLGGNSGSTIVTGEGVELRREGEGEGERSLLANMSLDFDLSR